MQGLVLRLLALAGVTLLALTLVTSFLLTWTIIPPGYTGVRINRLVARGISHEDILTGFVWYNPVQTQIVVYPTFVQRVVWTQDAHEGNPQNEEITFNTRDSTPVSVDVAVSYMLDPAQVPDFYTRFRADRIDTFTHGFMRDATRNVLTDVASRFNFDEINGDRKETFLAEVQKELTARLLGFGVKVQQFGIVGSFRPPRSLLEAVAGKNAAIQSAIRTENELRTATAEARKRVAIAEGEAAANKVLSSSLDDRLLRWEELKIQREWITKWNGQQPAAVIGGGATPLINIPVGKLRQD
jgi:regulator of protease activity HflC (stomatin/prohibitin superfamily)